MQGVENAAQEKIHQAEANSGSQEQVAFFVLPQVEWHTRKSGDLKDVVHGDEEFFSSHERQSSLHSLSKQEQ